MHMHHISRGLCSLCCAGRNAQTVANGLHNWIVVYTQTLCLAQCHDVVHSLYMHSVIIGSWNPGMLTTCQTITQEHVGSAKLISCSMDFEGIK